MSNAAKSIKSTSPTPPAATRRAALALAVGSLCALAGDYNAGGERRALQWLDPVTRQVQAGPGLLAAVQGAAGAEVGGALLVLGGRTGDGRDTVTDAVWTLRP
jgi:hypothetical protein